MNCSEVEKFVYAYVDGEFDDSDRSEFEAHVASCPECRRLVSFEDWFCKRLKEGLACETVPEGLEQRIHAALRKAEGGNSVSIWWRRAISVLPGQIWKPVPALAAVGALAFFLWPAMGSSPVVSGALERHRRNLPVEVTGPDDVTVRAWFRDKVDFPVNIPRFAGMHKAHLLGGRLSHLGERQAAYVVYDVNGAKVTVLAFKGKGLKMPSGRTLTLGHRPVVVHNEDGYSSAVYTDRGVVYTVTSEMDEEEMIGLVSTSLDIRPAAVLGN